MLKVNTVTRFFVIAIALLASSCSQQATIKTISGWAQGTTYQLTFWAEHPIDKKQIEAEITRELQRIDNSISTYLGSSVISRFNTNDSREPIEVNQEITELFSAAKAISIQSSGCYDPTILPAFKAWGFLDDKLVIPSKTDLDDIRERVGINKIELVSPTTLRKLNPKSHLDLSSIGQGYSVKRLANILESAGITDYLVEIGGEMQVRGTKPDNSAWRVAVEKPNKERQEIMEVIELSSENPTAVMTSGTYRHYYSEHDRTFSHIIDARTLKPVKHNTVSVTVVHDDATLADAWSTALLCLGSHEGFEVAQEQNIKAMFIDKSSELSVKKTASFTASGQ